MRGAQRRVLAMARVDDGGVVIPSEQLVFQVVEQGRELLGVGGLADAAAGEPAGLSKGKTALSRREPCDDRKAHVGQGARGDLRPDLRGPARNGTGCVPAIGGLRKLSANRGWEVVARYTDNDISALKGKRRPSYDVMMAAAARGEFDQIVTYGLSRIWRNRRERAEAIEVLSMSRTSVALVKGIERRSHA